MSLIFLRWFLMFSKWLAFQSLRKTNQFPHKMVCISQKCKENSAGKAFNQNCKCSCCQKELFTYDCRNFKNCQFFHTCCTVFVLEAQIRRIENSFWISEKVRFQKMLLLNSIISAIFAALHCRYVAGLDIIFQRLPGILSSRSTIWSDMSNRNFNIIFIFFALCVGTSTRNARLEIQHAVNPQQFNENLTVHTTRKGLNIAEEGILTTF